jgi:hypothetical protein
VAEGEFSCSSRPDSRFEKEALAVPVGEQAVEPAACAKRCHNAHWTGSFGTGVVQDR